MEKLKPDSPTRVAMDSTACEMLAEVLAQTPQAQVLTALALRRQGAALGDNYVYRLQLTLERVEEPSPAT